MTSFPLRLQTIKEKNHECTVKILSIKTVNELDGYWTKDDIVQHMDKMNLLAEDK